MVATGAEERLLFCSPAVPSSCVDITHARKLGLVRILANGPAVEVLADAGYQGLGAQTGGRVVTPPHRKFRRNPPEWYEEMHERQRRAYSSHRIRVGHGIGHLKNWRALARTFGLSGSSFTLTSCVRSRLDSVSALVSTADSPHERTSWLSCGGCGGGSEPTNRLVRASSRVLGSWCPGRALPRR
ncbi:hypothetical protein GCM10009716_27200 [Streptomyces sodiiphilus]|uniref:DDE Tnp4 domain-containing protein n=1 Tax=Streptomyces sodiiphilus TaxID=226217 RepID=A0ABN2PBP3_9ACTN